MRNDIKNFNITNTRPIYHWNFARRSQDVMAAADVVAVTWNGNIRNMLYKTHDYAYHVATHALLAKY